MQVSHSRIETFKKCGYQYKLKYIDGLKTYFNNDPANPLVIGTALHTGIEKSVEEAIKEYYSNYPVIDDKNIDEAIKLEEVIKKCKEVLPDGLHEVKIESKEFIGYIDLLAPVPAEEITPDDRCANCYKRDDCPHADCGSNSCMQKHEWYDLYDFKYSNNVDNYLKSGQLHEYKYYFERLNPTKHIRKMYFLFAPKVAIKMKYKNKTNKRDETIEEFRKRLKSELNGKEAQLIEVEYNTDKVIEFLKNAKECRSASKFDKNPTRLCDWCEFKNYCYSNGKEDLEIMNLPKNERRVVETSSNKKIWFYGAPFSGKTYLANKFPEVLMLNTDGNIKYVDAPFIAIKDEVSVEGRVTKRKFAWEVFKDAINELEKKQNDFKSIVVDLLEDTYEYCRLYMYDQLGITHESDDSFKAWDKVRTEFLSTIKRLMNLDYENIILISHEDTSKDLTKKGGDKITAIKPNLQDKAALKIAGMVDLVARIIDDEGKRTISFKTNEVIFGGGRLGITIGEIPCDYDALIKVYNDASNTLNHSSKGTRGESVTKSTETATANPTGSETPEGTTRTRRTSETKVEEPVHKSSDTFMDEIETKNAELEKLPKRRTRTEPTEHEKKVEAFKADHQPKEESTPRRVRRTRTTQDVAINDDDLPF